MSEPKPLHPGDPCPVCGGAFRPVPAPTDAQRAAANNRDNPVPLPPHVDSATPDQLEDLGRLHRCADCGYLTRWKTDDGGTGPTSGAGSSSSASGAGHPSGDGGDELEQLRRENAELRARAGSTTSGAAAR